MAHRTPWLSLHRTSPCYPLPTFPTQVAVGCGLPPALPTHPPAPSASAGGAPRPPPAEPLAHVCVYDMESGAATWRLPLLPPLDALLPLPPGAPASPPSLADGGRGQGGGGGSAAHRALAERVSCLAHAGVCALQFSPQVGNRHQ